METLCFYMQVKYIKGRYYKMVNGKFEESLHQLVVVDHEQILPL